MKPNFPPALGIPQSPAAAPPAETTFPAEQLLGDNRGAVVASPSAPRVHTDGSRSALASAAPLTERGSVLKPTDEYFLHTCIPLRHEVQSARLNADAPGEAWTGVFEKLDAFHRAKMQCKTGRADLLAVRDALFALRKSLEALPHKDAFASNLLRQVELKCGRLLEVYMAEPEATYLSDAEKREIAFQKLDFELTSEEVANLHADQMTPQTWQAAARNAWDAYDLPIAKELKARVGEPKPDWKLGRLTLRRMSRGYKEVLRLLDAYHQQKANPDLTVVLESLRDLRIAAVRYLEGRRHSRKEGMHELLNHVEALVAKHAARVSEEEQAQALPESAAAVPQQLLIAEEADPHFSPADLMRGLSSDVFGATGKSMSEDDLKAQVRSDTALARQARRKSPFDLISGRGFSRTKATLPARPHPVEKYVAYAFLLLASPQLSGTGATVEKLLTRWGIVVPDHREAIDAFLDALHIRAATNEQLRWIHTRMLTGTPA